MSEQNERAYQKQAQIFQNRKGTSKGLKARYWRNPGLGFKIPLEAKNGTYIDKKCPFTGSVSNSIMRIKGKIRDIIPVSSSFQNLSIAFTTSWE